MFTRGLNGKVRWFGPQLFLASEDDGGGGGGGGDGTGDPGTGDPGTGDPRTGDPGDKDKGNKLGDKMISQETFNRKMAELRATSRKETDALMKQFEAIQNRLNLSEKEKEEIAQSLEEVRTAGMTEKQKLEHQLMKTQEQLKTETSKWTQEASTWKERFENTQLQTQIQDAVIVNKGIDSEHFLALMRLWGTKIKEVVIDDKPTGRYEARVMFPDTDTEGNPIMLDLTVGETVKRMAEMKRHQHLFNHGQAEGTGMQSGQYSADKPGELPDFSKMTYEQYEAFVKANPSLVGEK